MTPPLPPSQFLHPHNTRLGCFPNVNLADETSAFVCHAVSKKKLKNAKKAELRRAKQTRTGKELALAKEEFKRDKKAQKLARRPAVQEQRRQRLLKRSKQLEIKGNKLLLEAKRVAEQYKLMTEAKEVCLICRRIGSPF